jgi:DNA-binding GntR family transcriptional regulator
VPFNFLGLSEPSQGSDGATAAGGAIANVARNIGSDVDLARNKVFELVRSEILSCSLMPGVELRESELAKRFGVSKSPVRDAMQKLEFEGLVEIEPRRGHRVRQISVRDAEDLLELRVVLETATVRKIASESTDEQLASLDQFRTADMSSIKAFASYNQQFHHALSILSDNRRMAEEMRRVMEFYDRLCVISLSTLHEKGFEEPLADHNAIIDALQARNGTLAARVLRKHITRSRGQIMRGLESRPIVA